MLKPTRRIITGIKNGHSDLLADETVNAIIPYTQYPCFQLQNLFYSEDNPQSLDTKHLDQPYNIELPEGAIRFIKIRMPTKQEMIADLKKNQEDIPQDWKKYNLHSTDSIDYLYILSGKISYVVGEKIIELSEGDFLTQIAPEHTWINDHDEPCYILCVMVGITTNMTRKKMEVK